MKRLLWTNHYTLRSVQHATLITEASSADGNYQGRLTTGQHAGNERPQNTQPKCGCFHNRADAQTNSQTRCQHTQDLQQGQARQKF